MKNILAIICTLLILASCSGGVNSTNAITNAETLLANNKYTGAKKICDNLVSQEGKNPLSARDLCRLSILYMKLSEYTNEDDNIATATLCFKKAVAMNTDSVEEFLSELPIEEIRYASIVRSLAIPVDNSQEEAIEEMTDSLDYGQQGLAD